MRQNLFGFRLHPLYPHVSDKFITDILNVQESEDLFTAVSSNNQQKTLRGRG